MIQFILILLATAFSGILWHIGGQGKKWARTIALPGLLALTKTVLTLYTTAWLWPMNILCLTYFGTLWAMLAAFSYGLNAPPHKFWVWIFKKGEQGDCKEVEIATRATCGFFWSLAAIVFMIVTGGWIYQIVYTVALSALVAYFGLKPDVKVSEIGTGCSIALSLLI